MKITLLGTGTSVGDPMIGCHCARCRSTDRRDKRLRPRPRTEHSGKNILIDTSADFRQQMLTAKITHLEAVLYTHKHYDHISGFDDLRAFQFLKQKAPKCFATVETANHIRHTFEYAFGNPLQKGGGLPEVEIIEIDERPFDLFGLRII